MARRPRTEADDREDRVPRTETNAWTKQCSGLLPTIRQLVVARVMGGDNTIGRLRAMDRLRRRTMHTVKSDSMLWGSLSPCVYMHIRTRVPPPCVEVLTGLENGKKKTQTMGNTQVFPMVLIFSQNKNSQKAKNIKNKILKFKMLLVFCSFFANYAFYNMTVLGSGCPVPC